ncbi:MAG: thioredoxin domain-containing protein [Sphingomonadales bacterium]|jgi:hypothetical protein
MPHNRLGQSTSPYLLQHKDNPVHWWPWCDDALQTAKDQDKVILLSVGYAACHWCHVMAHESFEDMETAELMNAHFINVKVDREERPDIDHIYQTALQLLGQQGGWPLTMFLTPDGKPFWGGTYFPKTPRYGQPAFSSILERITQVYKERDPAVFSNAENISNHIQKLVDRNQKGELTPDILNTVASQLYRHLDPENGGFGKAPKFPNVMNLELLWRHFLRTKDEAYGLAVENALTHICEGGIYDHLGGGFSRYTVDERWLIPHFEKMLYDNALLLRLLTQVWRHNKSPLYARRIEETIAWLQRDMMSDEGLFISSFDADSEGEEGKFYVWSEAEIDTLLKDQAAAFKAIYDVTPSGNWEGKTILNRLHNLNAADHMQDQRQILLKAREKRIPPGRDDKILCDWNALNLLALAEAAMTFGRGDWLEQAASSFNALLSTLRPDGQLYHNSGKSKLGADGFLEDHVTLALASLMLFSTTGNNSYLQEAIALEKQITKEFAAPNGGYYMAKSNASYLIAKPRPIADQATPAGNGLMVALLSRLHSFTGEDEYQKKMDTLISTFAGEIHRNVFPLGSFLNGFDDHISTIEILIKSEKQDIIDAVWQNAPPQAVIRFVKEGEKTTLNEHHPAYSNLQKPGDYVLICQRRSCSLPLTRAQDIIQTLKS